MKNKIILAIMQLKGIGRKTIINDMDIQPGTECCVLNIVKVLNQANLKNKKIPVYDEDAICGAIEKAERIIDNCKMNNIGIVSFLDEDYPAALYEINDPPTVLYYKGNIKCLNKYPCAAIVGTRYPTSYGRKIAENLGESLAKKGYAIVSGLALGCDSGGHEGCLKANGKTIAVMAGGLDKIYPVKNKKLAEKILEADGVLISEYPPYTEVFKNQFVERDRLQSGLSKGIIVVETTETGGTLHTVEYGMDYKRVIGCYEHPEKFHDKEQTKGNQMLIREGKAMKLSDDADLSYFIKKMEKKTCQDYIIKTEQISIYDFMQQEGEIHGTNH